MNQFQKTIKSIFLNLTLVLAFVVVFIVTIPSKAFCYYDRFESEFIDLTKWQENDQREILSLLRSHPYFEFRLIAMELWLRIFFNNESPDLLADTLLDIRNRVGTSPF